MEARFSVDGHLGRLAKWLRALGYDTLYECRVNADIIARALAEGRTVLTRERRLAQSAPSGSALLLGSDRWQEQLSEVLGAFSLSPRPDQWLSRCLRCNALLEAIGKTAVEARVPAYVCQSHDRFRYCRVCGRIYWPGSHRNRMEEVIRRRSPGDHR